jgi:ABC-type sugar transport system ATPase subunit
VINRDAHVELRGVSKRYGGVQALRDVDLRIERGSIHGLVGENGAGKSTLSKVIAGAVQPDSGELIVNGRKAQYRSPRDALADGITLVAQELALLPRRSVIENVFLGIESSRLGFVVDVDSRREYARLSERLGFGIPPKVRVGTLRTAEQQKVEILRALARHAELIVMDEPTAALTIDEAERLFAIIKSLQAGGTTIVYVSHLLDQVLNLVDTVTVLRDGQLVRTGPAANETPESLVVGMLGRSLNLAFPEKSFPAADAPVVLSVRDLSRTGALEDVSFDVKAGEIVGLAGLIGSGRSEVARAIFGADRRDRGTVELDGAKLRLRQPKDAVRAGIAMLPESRKEQGLLMGRSIVENVTLPHLGEVSTGGFLAGGKQLRETSALTTQLDVRARRVTSRVDTLSGGNQQKVLFAKWLFRRPRVLIADEPTRGVDVGAKRSIYELIARLAGEGMAVVLISSELEEVIGLAHRVLVMRRGRIVAEFDGRTVSEDAVMHAAFATATTPALSTEAT